MLSHRQSFGGGNKVVGVEEMLGPVLAVNGHCDVADALDRT